MSEAREYVSQPDELGNIHISDEVLAVIAAAAALEVEGVGSLSSTLASDITELTGRKVLSKGVRLHAEEGSVTVEVSILIQYGYTIPTVAHAVQEAVMAAVGNTSGLQVESVNVHVAGVSFPHEKHQ
ncbi:MAG: Asp23/Gls24 family envelope stress response protein [Oscillospiraceae bacterium]